MCELTLGSLFSGSGGFELAAQLSGIRTKWNCEIEPFPSRVTEIHFPEARHYCDVRKMNGREVSPVDIVTFGSPCQDLSVAGRRDGINGGRSRLFFEAIRIIREMREATDGKYPRYAVWENVPNALSSNGGDDFWRVLTAFVQTKEANVSIPRPARWNPAGEIVGDGYSLAWRELDAQYWGVPQRRKRVFLVADFRGDSAGKILFESEGVPGNSAQDFRARQTAPRNASPRARISGKLSVFENHLTDARYNAMGQTAMTVTSRYGTGGNNQPLVVLEGNGARPPHRGVGYKESETMYTLNAAESHSAAYSTSKNYHHTKASEELASALVASDYKDPPTVARDYEVRRLTPTECARLQGFPDDWCEGLGDENPDGAEIEKWQEIFAANGQRKTERQIRKWLLYPRSDSAEYIMWGNGVALPCVRFVLSGIAHYAQK